MTEKEAMSASGTPARGARSPGTGLPYEALIQDAQQLSLEEFRRKFGDGFLLATATRVYSRRTETTTELLLGTETADPSARTADLGITVYPLRPSPTSPGTLATLGRGFGHDVTIPDASISRFHAFVKQEDGVFLIQDADSTNGSSVNGSSVPTRGTGVPTPLRPGDNVRLGRMEFTFVDADRLQGFVLKAGA